ncbi:TIGR04282 family arsenosugar biosynthesis glycosyltransferase [Spongiivirga citrea]|uniref:TIGR04282 family arsenosugar biosynthesis glycosyltransferase n=1 Tax=Spongiivirga citrea TaxID=1481457 RepID=UPI001EF8FBD1|nr:TIGR04282 family arsenosugar biosynthesis glycosyltransferase [Spongiivirga citrea]
MKQKSKNLLLIFTRNPELGKVKTRLAKTIGNEAALNIYKFLLEHTKKVTQTIEVDKQVHYSVKIRENDIWDAATYNKRLQKGEDLGKRMAKAFQDAFNEGYNKVVIIGSDLYDLSTQDISEAFDRLDTNQVVIGPATDGGYYLLGLTTMIPEIFEDKAWGTSTVFNDTLANVQDKKYLLLNPKNDVDVYDDIKDIDIFNQFI